MKKSRKLIIVTIFFIFVISLVFFFENWKISEYITDKRIVYTPNTIAKKYYNEFSIDIFEYWIFILNEKQKQVIEEELGNSKWSKINGYHMSELFHFLMYEEDLEKILESENCYICVYDRYNDKIITNADKYVYDALTQKIIFVYEMKTGTYICIHETI